MPSKFGLKTWQKAWLAGFIDGDGCINFIKIRNNYYPRVIITNTDLQVLENIKDHIGGDIRVNTTNLRNHPKWKPGYQLRVSYSTAADLLGELLPYLQLKHDQALLAIGWQTACKGKPNDQEKQEVCQWLVAECKKLNKKGLASATV